VKTYSDRCNIFLRVKTSPGSTPLVTAVVVVIEYLFAFRLLNGQCKRIPEVE